MSAEEDYELSQEDSAFEEQSESEIETNESAQDASEEFADNDEDEEGRFGCMMTSGKADPAGIWSMAVIYGLPVVFIALRRASRKRKSLKFQV